LTRRKRVQRIETSLTPKQAVLLWLRETRELGEIESLEKSLRTPRHEKPRFRIPVMVGKAVQESLSKRGNRPEVARQAAYEAQKQTDFLIVLVKELTQAVNLERRVNAPYILLLFEKLDRMLEQFAQSKKFNPTIWELWRATLIERLYSMWQLRDTIDTISEKYYDGQPLLFPEQANNLAIQVRDLEESAKRYNRLKGRLPAWRAIDLDALASAIREHVLAEVEERVAIAKSKSLEDFGESEAASKIIEPYELAMLERLRSPAVRATERD
jgi:hypothetical protein